MKPGDDSRGSPPLIGKEELSLIEVEPGDKKSPYEFVDHRETRAQLLREYVGGKNRSYYMAAFHRFEQHPYLP